jgi:CRISPR/Cas system CMR-associated protein Cmr5 small subunit
MQITGKWLPALIMNNGLMQGMAFLHEKGQKVSQKHCAFLGQQLRAWLKWLRKMAAARQG